MSEAPSTRAASTKSRGMVRKYCRSRNVPKAPPQNAGSQSGTLVPIKCKYLKMMKLGIRVTCGGISRVNSRSVKSRSRPLNLTTAKQKAAIAQVSSCPTVVRIEIYALFQNNNGKLMSTEKSSRKLLNVKVGGIRVFVNWSPGNLKEHCTE